MDFDPRRIALDYVRVWDVSAPDGLADDLFDQEVVDHNLQPGQGPGLVLSSVSLRLSRAARAAVARPR